MELDDMVAGEEFPATRIYELMRIIIDLKKGDETFEAQKSGIKRDLIPQALELKEKYNQASEAEREKIVATLKMNIERWLTGLQRR